jgi:RNA ligase partner protein
MDVEVKEVPRRRRSPLRLILDTSVFTNPDVYRAFGDNPTEALKAFSTLAAKTEEIEFFMPISIYENELKKFISPADIPPDFYRTIQKKSPRMHGMNVPATLLYELIHDVRVRVDKGLRIAEKAVRESLKFSHDEAKAIATLRKKYKEALREGIIDSKEDVELILLAMELDGTVVTADSGILAWVKELGIRWLHASRLKGVLEASVQKR